MASISRTSWLIIILFNFLDFVTSRDHRFQWKNITLSYQNDCPASLTLFSLGAIPAVHPHNVTKTHWFPTYYQIWLQLLVYGCVPSTRTCWHSMTYVSNCSWNITVDQYTKAIALEHLEIFWIFFVFNMTFSYQNDWLYAINYVQQVWVA